MKWVILAVSVARRLAVLWTLALAIAVIFAGGSSQSKPTLFVAAGLLTPLAGCRWQRWRYTRLFEIAITNLVACFWVMELILRLSSTPLAAPWWDGYRLEPGRDYGLGLRGGSLGFPAPELPTRKGEANTRIVALGDSFLVGPAVAYEDCFLSLIQKQTGAQVVNLGVSGSGPREYRQTLERHGLALQPDLVLIHVFVGNDITEQLALPRNLDPRCFAAYRFFLRLSRLMRNREQQTAAAVADRRHLGRMSPEQFREVEARRIAVCSADPSPVLEKKWQKAITELRQAIQLCRVRGITVALVLIPDELQVREDLWDEARQAANLDPIKLDCRYPQARLLQFAKSEGVECLDLLPIMANTPACYAERDTHWNERGNQIAAESLIRAFGIARILNYVTPAVP